MTKIDVANLYMAAGDKTIQQIYASDPTITSLNDDDLIIISRKVGPIYQSKGIQAQYLAELTSIPDATATIKGKLKLTGDLGGTSDSPIVKGSSSVTVSSMPRAAGVEVADYHIETGEDPVTKAQQAIDAMAARPDGGIVEFLQGTFAFGAPLVPRSNVWIKGQGMWGKTILTTKPNANFAVLDNYDEYHHGNADPDFQQWTNGMLSDIELDGSNIDRTKSNKCFNSSSSYKCQTFRVYAHDSTATGLGMDDYTAGWIYDCYVENCGYVNRHTITAASWATNIFSFTTADNHGYTAATFASGTLTASGTISDGDTVILDQYTYTFKTTLSGAAFEVLINGSTANAIINLQKAVKLNGVSGTDYGTGTIKHPTVTVSSITTTTLVVQALSSGATPNSIITAETGANISFASGTLSGGISGSVIVITGMVPAYYNGRFVVSTIPSATTFTVTTTQNSGSLNLPLDPGTATIFGTTSDSIIGHNGIGIASGTNSTESTLVFGNVCVRNQNNNFLIEQDLNLTGPNAGYIYSGNISVEAGMVGYQNTGTPNFQCNDNYDFGSPIGAQAASTSQTRTITAATWSGGIATFTTSTDHNYSGTGAPDGVTHYAEIENMYPNTWNGSWTVIATPSSTTFQVVMASNPGTASMFGTSTYTFHNVSGTQFNNNILSYNRDWGIRLPAHSDGVQIIGTTIKYALNYGLQINSSTTQISNVRIHDTGRQGIYITTSNSNVVALSDVQIDNPMIWNTGKRGTGGVGIEIAPGTGLPIQNMTISNPRIFDNQDTKTQDYGILIRSGGALSNISITGGNLTGNNISPILIQDTSGVVYANNIRGVNPAGIYALGSVTGSPAFDVTNGNVITATLGGNITPAFTTPLIDGSMMTLILTQDATGGRTLSVPANVAVKQTPIVSPQANAVDRLYFVYVKAISKWQLVSQINYNPLFRTTVAIGDNVQAMTITQNDTTNNPEMFNATNAGTAMGMRITQSGILATNSYGMFVDSGAAQTTSPLVRMRLSSASSTQATLQLDNSGTGPALNLNSGALKLGTLSGLLKATSGTVSVAAGGTDYYAPGGTDVAIADGGTGASTAGTALTNLGAADDTLVVHLAGIETISGVKTFTSTITISGTQPTLSFSETDQTAPAGTYKIDGQSDNLRFIRSATVLGGFISTGFYSSLSVSLMSTSGTNASGLIFGADTTATTLYRNAANSLSTSATLLPVTTATYNLGSSTLRWGTLFAGSLNLSNASAITLASGSNIVLSTTIGTMIGTSTTQLRGYYGVTPVGQGSAIADATATVTSVQTQLNLLLARQRATGDIAP